MKKLTATQLNRIATYVQIIENTPKSKIPKFLQLPYDLNSLEMIIKDGEYNPSIYSDLLNDIEKWCYGK